VPNFQNSRDETLHNKPILFVPKRIKTHLRQCRIQKISGGGPPDPPLQGEGEGGREEWKRGGDEEGRGEGRGGRKGRVEGKGLRKGKGRKEEKKEEGKGRGIWTPQCSRQIDAYV
jgi:hypothetical protein